MATPGPQKVKKYSLEFKLKAVTLSEQPGVLVKDVAESLCAHPFMLSRWRKEVRDSVLSGKAQPPDAESVAEFKRLREVERQYKQLQQEHDLLKQWRYLAVVMDRSLAASLAGTWEHSARLD